MAWLIGFALVVYIVAMAAKGAWILAIVLTIGFIGVLVTA